MTPLKRVASLVAALLLFLLLWFVWRVLRDHGAVPLTEGNVWRYRWVDGDGRAASGTAATPDKGFISLHLDGAAQFKGTDAMLVSCERERPGSGVTEMGRGYVIDHWTGLDLIGVQGPLGERVVNLRLLPYPLPYGSDWTSALGDSWADRWKAVSRGATELETVTVPLGSYQTLHVTTDIRFASQPPAATVDYWVAQDVGPVKVRVDLHDAHPTVLELVEHKP